jgi:hypothetical protein
MNPVNTFISSFFKIPSSMSRSSKLKTKHSKLDTDILDSCQTSSKWGQSKYKPKFFLRNVLITTCFAKSNSYLFLHILPAPLHIIAIAWVASLCPFQKEFVVARPATVAQKFYFIVGSKSFPS